MGCDIKMTDIGYFSDEENAFLLTLIKKKQAGKL